MEKAKRVVLYLHFVGDVGEEGKQGDSDDGNTNDVDNFVAE